MRRIVYSAFSMTNPNKRYLPPTQSLITKLQKEYDSLLDLNSKAFSRVFSPKSEKYFQNIKYFAWSNTGLVFYR